MQDLENSSDREAKNKIKKCALTYCAACPQEFAKKRFNKGYHQMVLLQTIGLVAVEVVCIRDESKSHVLSDMN